MCLSDAMDLISPVVVDHHKKVAILADAIGEKMELSWERRSILMLASLLHDSGAISLKERINALEFEIENPHKHSELGYLLLKDFPFYLEVADIVRHHHDTYEDKGDSIPEESHIVHLADRISVLIKKDEPVLAQKGKIKEKIEKEKGKMFMPDLVDAFLELSERESFWLDVVAGELTELLSFRAKPAPALLLDIYGLLEVGNLFRRVIDFRSAFTSTHSSGVAASAEALARLIGFSRFEHLSMRMAGYLHDLGKLSVPREILEKPGKLNEDEFRVIKTHTYHTYRTLQRIPQLDTINKWGALHHEKLDGSGYPFGCSEEELSLGSRIMAVADIFTALTEDRPYREGMGKEKVSQILTNQVEKNALDNKVVELLLDNYQEVNEIREKAQESSREEYKEYDENISPYD